MKENTILVCGDIHGRKFWKEPSNNIEIYEKVIFLGDYLDPYNFEDITVADAIENFKQIIQFKKNNMNKVVLLIGNHDLPYFSTTYYNFSMWHCRHSSEYHNEIQKIFEDNSDLFQLAYTYNNILFTHAGVESKWLTEVLDCKEENNIDIICNTINELLKTKEGLRKLYCITPERGGRDRFGSCVWADVHDIMWDSKPLEIKQIFGHTMQAYYDQNRNIAFGDAIEFDNCKMIDTAKPYVLDTDNFEIK
jgi:predicted phosphodiesterase